MCGGLRGKRWPSFEVRRCRVAVVVWLAVWQVGRLAVYSLVGWLVCWSIGVWSHPMMGVQHILRIFLATMMRSFMTHPKHDMTWKTFFRATRPKVLCASPKNDHCTRKKMSY